ncbi:MAG TPA: hypothetical protein VFG87_16355 [Amycolatopsis sp.]|jgi:hypothetical protein|nr:hypothetical protein [Amycolatopsis sp.]
MIKKVLAGLLLCVVTLFTAPTATAEASTVVRAVSAGPVAQQTPAPPGPRIDPAETAKANAEQTKSKIIVGVIALVLAGLVVWGRSIRRKRRKAAGG